MDVFATCLSPASFWLPEKITASAWHRHAPFAFWLMEAARPRVFVELGTYYGFSYLAFCQLVRHLGLSTRCHAVDTWQGDEHSGFYGEEVFNALRRYHDSLYSGFSRLIRANFDAALHEFADGSIDLLHIDGRHRYEDVRHDFEAWRPKLSARAIVLFHDTQVKEGDFGVYRYWEEISREYPHFEFIRGYGLGVLGVGAEIPERVKPLFAAARDELSTKALRDAYARLGGGVIDLKEKMRMEAVLKETQAKMSNLKKRLAEMAGGSAREDEREDDKLASPGD
jgi:hypothetical protein